MGCSSCGKSKTAGSRYEVTLLDGSKQTYGTRQEAEAARAAAGGGTIRLIGK